MSLSPVMNPLPTTILLLTISNVFMTFAWYAHLKELNNKPWIIAALVSWGIALSNTCCRSRRTGLGIPCSAWAS